VHLASLQHLPTLQRQYYLCSGVHLRKFPTSHILLDCDADRYFRFTGQQSAWLAEINQADDCSRLSSSASRFANRLLEMKLITCNPDEGKHIRLHVRPHPRSALYDMAPTVIATHFQWRAISAFLHACVSAGHLRRTADLKHTLNCATKWRAICSRSRPAEEIQDLTRYFHSLTPFVFSSHEVCFFRSLVLLRFLSLMGVGADWEFGVRPLPFSAHCWVEHEGMVLNDHLDHVSEYRKIMSV